MRYLNVTLLALALSPGAGAAQSIVYGDDSSEWARDGECDDRRFTGKGMAQALDRDDIGRDATDCRRLCRLGQIALRNP